MLYSLNQRRKRKGEGKKRKSGEKKKKKKRGEGERKGEKIKPLRNTPKIDECKIQLVVYKPSKLQIYVHIQ